MFWLKVAEWKGREFSSVIATSGFVSSLKKSDIARLNYSKIFGAGRRNPTAYWKVKSPDYNNSS